MGSRRSWYQVRASLDQPIRQHDLRHTCVTLLLEAGVPPYIVQQIAGHSALDVTMNITLAPPSMRSAPPSAFAVTDSQDRAAQG